MRLSTFSHTFKEGWWSKRSVFCIVYLNYFTILYDNIFKKRTLFSDSIHAVQGTQISSSMQNVSFFSINIPVGLSALQLKLHLIKPKSIINHVFDFNSIEWRTCFVFQYGYQAVKTTTVTWQQIFALCWRPYTWI